MIKGFKDFILRGNVIDLAVAVVIGAAFTALVAAFTSNIIEPVLNIFGGVDTGTIGFYLVPSNPGTYINVSAILNAIITFLITALVVSFVFVAPMKKFLDIAAKRKQPIKALLRFSVLLLHPMEVRPGVAQKGAVPLPGRLIKAAHWLLLENAEAASHRKPV